MTKTKNMHVPPLAKVDLATAKAMKPNSLSQNSTIPWGYQWPLDNRLTELDFFHPEVSAINFDKNR